jgi:type II secretory pathway pseudopilin PulG
LASLLVVIAILGVVLTLAYRYFSYGRKVVTEVRAPERYTSLQKRFESSASDLKPKVEAQWKVIWPDLRALAKQKAEAARPELEAVLKAQGEILKKNLNDMAGKKAEDLAKRVVEENKDTLQKDYPALADPAKLEALVEMLVKATEQAAFKVFSARFEEHEKVLADVDIWRHKLPLADAKKSNKELLTRLGEVSWDLLLIKTGETPAPAAPAAAQPKPAPARTAAPAPAAPAAAAPAPAAPAPAAPAPAPAAPAPAAPAPAR